MNDTDNLIQRLRRAVEQALTFSDDVVDDRAVPFDDLVMRDRALAAFDAELRLLHASFPASPVQPKEPDWRWYDTKLRAQGDTDLANRLLAEFKPHLQHNSAPLQPEGEQERN